MAQVTQIPGFAPNFQANLPVTAQMNTYRPGWVPQPNVTPILTVNGR